ncbi:MAG TPA: hypothetical protein VFZ09_12590 [Archangium sp.]|uniref:hypothetical protein n=1 Tax=Archangium sp. TaxID=1872627 RepID=UPI002E346B3F|nr:hypothetical protein [Archangium sp.]HEX5747073.1 hypothetical protein [Archangium sp.]
MTMPMDEMGDYQFIEAGGVAIGAITQDVQEIPGGEFAFTATDPSGAMLGFVGPKGA